MRSKLAHNVARIRTIRNWSQRQLAVIADCSHATIQSIEQGKLKLSHSLASRLAVSLSVPAEWLLANDLESPIPLLVDWEMESWL